MIKPIGSVDVAIEALRNELMSQTGLTEEYILNGKSIKGATLGRLVNNVIIPFTTSDLFIVFDANPDREEEVSMTELDNTMTTYAGYAMQLIIYGDKSYDLAQLIFARLRSAEVKNRLRKVGVFISSISPVESANEYINSIMWCRADMTISFAVRYNFTKTTIFADMKTAKLTIN